MVQTSPSCNVIPPDASPSVPPDASPSVPPDASPSVPPDASPSVPPDTTCRSFSSAPTTSTDLNINASP
uniref:Uncharacterized protein n=1 Tax=Periophthalmus magnuspinnatus TaxID=409849 RepID=A0A3B4B1Z6_9GOBI